MNSSAPRPHAGEARSLQFLLLAITLIATLIVLLQPNSIDKTNSDIAGVISGLE